MSKELRDTDYLDHIHEAIAKIGRYTVDVDETGFINNELTQDGVIRNLEIIGEAVSKLSSELKARHSDVPWMEISGMRNRLIHGYMSVNMAIVWDTVQKVVPSFNTKVLEIQRMLKSSHPGNVEAPVKT